MTATVTDFAALTSGQIMQMVADLTGKPARRAASRAEAVARYERAVAASGSVTQSEPAAPALVVEEPAPAIVEAAPAPVPTKAARAGKVAPAAPAKAAPAKAAPTKATPATAKTAARKPAPPTPAGEPRAGSKRAVILEMIRRPGGATEAEVCNALGWVAAGATIGRVLRSAGIEPRRERDAASGKVRYFAR